MKTKFGVKEVADVVFYVAGTTTPVLVFDSLKLSNIENAAEAVYANGGKGNARLLGWDFNRTASVNLQDALLTTKGLALLAGQNDATVGAEQITRREELTVVGGKVTVAQTPVNGTVKAYKDGDYSTALTTAVAAKEVTITGANDGDVIEVFYDWTTPVTTETVTFDSNKFPGYYTVKMDTVMRNEKTGQDEPVQFIIPKAKLQPGFTFTMEASGDPSAFDFKLEVFKDSASEQMIKVVKYIEA
jgi:hypothetical protein